MRLAPGNSGGPLADINGHILGVNTMVASGLALSIPVATVQAFSRVLPSAHWRGLAAGNAACAASACKTRVDGSGTDTKRGCRRASLLPGDILLNANSQPLHSADDLALALTGHTVELEFHRAGNSRIRRVTVQLTHEPFVSAA